MTETHRLARKPANATATVTATLPAGTLRTAEPDRFDYSWVRRNIHARRSAFALAPDAPSEPRCRPPKLVMSASAAAGHNKRHAVIDLNRTRACADPLLGSNKSRNKLAHAVNGNTNDFHNATPTPSLSQPDSTAGFQLQTPPSSPLQTATQPQHANRDDDPIEHTTSPVDHSPDPIEPATSPAESHAPDAHDGLDHVTGPMADSDSSIPAAQPDPPSQSSSDETDDAAGDVTEHVGRITLELPAPDADHDLSPTLPCRVPPTPTRATVPSAVVPSDAGGEADVCSHGPCRREVWACCVQVGCGSPLCHVHFGPNSTTPPFAASRCHEHGRPTEVCRCLDCRLSRGAVSLAALTQRATGRLDFRTAQPIHVCSTTDASLRRGDGPTPERREAAPSRSSIATLVPHAAVTAAAAAAISAADRNVTATAVHSTPSQRQLTDEQLALIAARRQAALERRRQLAIAPRPRTLTPDDLRLIASNRAAALAKKRQLDEARDEPQPHCRRLQVPPCPGLNLPPGWQRLGWVAPEVPATPLDFKTSTVPQAGRSYFTVRCEVQLERSLQVYLGVSGEHCSNVRASRLEAGT
jgi:hypothetical protein